MLRNDTSELIKKSTKRLIILYKVRNCVPQSLHEKIEKIRSGKIPSSHMPNAD